MSGVLTILDKKLDFSELNSFYTAIKFSRFALKTESSFESDALEK